MAEGNPKTTSRTTPAKGQVVLDPDVAQWITAVLFPPTDSGRQGVVLNAADADFDAAAAMVSRAKAQLAG